MNELSLYEKNIILLLNCRDNFNRYFRGGKDKKELASIKPGLYEINFDVKYGGQLVMLKQRVRYKSDGSYEEINFQNNMAKNLKESLRWKTINLFPSIINNASLLSKENEHKRICQK